MTFYVIIDKKGGDKALLEAITSGAVFTTRNDAAFELTQGFDPEQVEVRRIEVRVMT